jgi:hypothetical protein
MHFLETANYDWMGLLNFYERPFRAKLIPAKVWKDLDKYENDSLGLSNYVKKWRTKIEWIEQKSKAKVYRDFIAIGGEYSPEDRQCTLIIHSRNFNSHIFTPESWDRFKYRFIQTLMHELIHFMQYDRRDDSYSNYVVPYKRVGHKKKDEERRYLSEFDEIQAYAHCVYLDFRVFKPNIDIDVLLSRCKRKVDSKTLHYFLKTFNYDFRNNVSPQKIVQQIAKWDRKYNRLT